jgi:hypothetical protein
MEENINLNLFPNTHVKPFDGMSVTADTWLKAHNEHRQALRAHDLFFHGSGIVFGLEVTANEPPNQFVYIKPGVAVDSGGNVIVLSETVAYDFSGSAEGLLYLIIGHGDRETGGVEDEVKFTHDEFVIAARPSIPKRPVVELGRINLLGAGKPILSPKDPLHPVTGELDFRFRSQLISQLLRPVHVGVFNLGKKTPESKKDWDYLGSECIRSHFCKLITDNIDSPNADINQFDLVCLSSNGTFKSDANFIRSLRKYLDTGKYILIEAIDEDAETAFNTLLEKLEVSLNLLQPDNPILTTPYLFNDIPQGKILTNDHVIYSIGGFISSWGGKTAASRADIRSAHEWGINLLSACLDDSG